MIQKGRKNAKARRRNQNNLRPPNSISPPPDRNRQQALDIYLIHDDRGNVVGIVSPSNGEPGRNGVILPGNNSELPRPMDWPPPYAEESPDMPPPTYEESNSNPV